MHMFDVITEVCVVSEFNNEGCTWRTFDVITEGYIVSSFTLIMQGVQCACLMLLLKGI